LNDPSTKGTVTMPQPKSRVVILGAGFGGLEAAKTLRRAPVEITLIDRQNYHCFQPLLYQVATAALSPADVAWPIRHILRRQENATVFMAEVTGIDAGARIVNTKAGSFSFDFLVIATGARPPRSSLPLLHSHTNPAPAWWFAGYLYGRQSCTSDRFG
jgi:NADH:ubiquinone reductase (H+-translocating)